MTKHHGSCHCGAVRYEVDLELNGKATRCNCTICTKLGITGATVKPAQFRLISGAEVLTKYAKNPFASRAFCSRCGTHCFGEGDLPQLGGAFVGVNLNTLDEFDVGQLELGYWDGRHDNWQAGLRAQPWPVTAPAPRAAAGA